MPFKTLEQQNEYYQRNKDKINESKSVKIECGCGVTHTKRHQAAHLRTPKHTNWLEANNIQIIKPTPEQIIEERKQKSKEHQQKYRDKNRDKLREYAKFYNQEYRKTHSEHIEAYQKQWFVNNYEKYKTEIEDLKQNYFEGDHDKTHESILIHALIQKLNQSKK